MALVHNGVVVQFLSYEGTFVAVGGPANGQTSTDIGVSEDGNGLATLSLRLTGTGAGYSDFTWAPTADGVAATPGNVNQGQIFAGTPTASISINDVTVAEGNAGTTTATFTVTVAGPHPQA